MTSLQSSDLVFDLDEDECFLELDPESWCFDDEPIFNNSGSVSEADSTDGLGRFGILGDIGGCRRGVVEGSCPAELLSVFAGRGLRLYAFSSVMVSCEDVTS